MIGGCRAVKASAARIGLWLSRWLPGRRRLAEMPIAAPPTRRTSRRTSSNPPVRSARAAWAWASARQHPRVARHHAGEHGVSDGGSHVGRRHALRRSRPLRGPGRVRIRHGDVRCRRLAEQLPDPRKWPPRPARRGATGRGFGCPANRPIWGRRRDRSDAPSPSIRCPAYRTDAVTTPDEPLREGCPPIPFSPLVFGNGQRVRCRGTQRFSPRRLRARAGRSTEAASLSSRSATLSARRATSAASLPCGATRPDPPGCAGTGHRKVIQMVFSSVYRSRASRPLSRPPKPGGLSRRTASRCSLRCSH